MPLSKLRRHAEAAWEVPRDLVLGRYPAFVSGGPLPKGHVPVFCFHSLDPDSFGRKIAHLAENGYVTLSADEYFQHLMGGKPAPEKAVVLTFDDGRASVRSVGLPLMRRYGMQGIVFIVPAHTVSRPGPLPPTWDEVRQGQAKAEAVLGRENADDAFLSWEEIANLTGSGLFEFQSHSLSHARVHTTPQLAGFMTPELRQGYGPLDVPLIHDGTRDLPSAAIPLGTPLFRSEPRLSEATRFYEDAAVREACVARVADEGAGFFHRRGWQRELRRLIGKQHVTGHLESAEARESAMRRELAEARREIEARTGKEAIHLCYPWHVSGPTSRRIAREVGYRTAFCGKLSGVPITLAGGNPQQIARVGEDYVELLPGKNRGNLTSILRLKLARRLGSALTEVVG